MKLHMRQCRNMCGDFYTMSSMVLQLVALRQQISVLIRTSIRTFWWNVLVVTHFVQSNKHLISGNGWETDTTNNNLAKKKKQRSHDVMMTEKLTCLFICCLSVCECVITQNKNGTTHEMVHLGVDQTNLSSGLTCIQKHTWEKNLHLCERFFFCLFLFFCCTHFIHLCWPL